MDVLQHIWCWMVEAEAWEWVFSGIGIPIAGWLILHYHKKPPAQDTTPPVSNTTFTHSGTGDQNIAQGDGAVGKQVDLRGAQIEVGSRHAMSLRDNAHVEGDIHFHNHDRTPQGIPLQRSQQADYLVGREKLLNQVLAGLQPGKALTLCGPGGMGKTALAARVAWELAPEQEAPALFPDGLIFYSFYGRKDVSLAYEHLLRSYLDEGQENGPEAVRRLLANKQALIVLDGAEEADNLPAVLRCCGGCGVLITSRKRSDAPAGLVEVKRLDELPAVEAFCLYSGTTANKDTVKAICEQLGGWPLALRIAGQYLRNTGESATDYLRFLAKAPFQRLGRGEHQEENAALLLRRSMDQVSEDARLALAMAGCLAFAPLGREPLMALLDSDELHACDALNELVLYGLLERKGQRWQVSHALIQTFARSQQPLNRDRLEQLAVYYIDFCTTQSAASLPGYALLDEERVHCLRLIESCLDRGLWQEVKSLSSSIGDYLDRQGHWSEDLVISEMNLTAARKAGDRRDEAWCLNSLGSTCWKRGEPDKALAWYEQSLPLWRELEDRQGEGVTLNNMANIYRQQGRYEQALEHYEQSLRIGQEVGDREGEGTTLNNIANVYMHQEQWEAALPYLEQCLPLRQEAGNKIGQGTTLNNIAAIYYAQGKPAKAVEYYKQALYIMQKLGDKVNEAIISWNLGNDYVLLGDLVKAEEYIALAVEIAEAIGHPSLEKYRNGLADTQAKRQEVRPSQRQKGISAFWNWLKRKRQAA